MVVSTIRVCAVACFLSYAGCATTDTEGRQTTPERAAAWDEERIRGLSYTAVCSAFGWNYSPNRLKQVDRKKFDVGRAKLLSEASRRELDRAKCKSPYLIWQLRHLDDAGLTRLSDLTLCSAIDTGQADRDEVKRQVHQRQLDERSCEALRRSASAEAERQAEAEQEKGRRELSECLGPSPLFRSISESDCLMCGEHPSSQNGIRSCDP